MSPMRGKRFRASTAITPAQENLSPISCEVCRQRKCKCDRQLPCCSQCASEPSKCVYPESSKRGLPLGYLNQLERRLEETESALYSALATLRSMKPATARRASARPVSAASVHKPKAARMDEWSRLPLRGWPDMDRWLTAMSDHFTIEQPQVAHGSSYAISMSPTRDHTHSTSVGVETQVPSGMYAWQPRDGDHLGSSHETHLRPPEMVSPSIYSRHQVSAESGVLASPAPELPGYSRIQRSHTSIPADGQSTRAEELSKSKPSIYF